MQTLGQERAAFPVDSKNRQRPRISLLSGTMNKGCCGLRAAVHLLNRGASVTVCFILPNLYTIYILILSFIQAFVPSQTVESLPGVL